MESVNSILFNLSTAKSILKFSSIKKYYLLLNYTSDIFVIDHGKAITLLLHSI